MIPGPCIVCGDTNYNLSCGGPTICPKCDCGNFDSATVLKQAKVIADLRAQLASVAQAPSNDPYARLRRGETVIWDKDGASAPAQAPSKEETFCHWLKGFLGAIKGRDELDAREANIVRNELNEMLDGTSPMPSTEHS